MKKYCDVVSVVRQRLMLSLLYARSLTEIRTSLSKYSNNFSNKTNDTIKSVRVQLMYMRIISQC